MRISDWSSDVCSSDLQLAHDLDGDLRKLVHEPEEELLGDTQRGQPLGRRHRGGSRYVAQDRNLADHVAAAASGDLDVAGRGRSEERRVGEVSVNTCRYRVVQYH